MSHDPADTRSDQSPAQASIRSSQNTRLIDRRISVAPMMDWTDRHCRYFLRGFSPRVMLYTEMITAQALAYGNRERLLAFSSEERPLALQLGGSDARMLADAARAGAAAGYDEINLNCGCPSDRVHAGSFGACLMAQPDTVARAVQSMRAAVNIPVTVKMRIGVLSAPVPAAAYGEFTASDFEQLCAFTRAVAQAGCERFIVHARKAVLGGLSPRENREVPALHYDVVERLKAQFPALALEVNGGIRTPAQALPLLACSDGIMLGREAYHRPQVLSELHQQVFDDSWRCPDVFALLERMAEYAERQVSAGERLSSITRHMLGLCTGRPGARRFRQLLSEGAREATERATAPQWAGALLRQAAALCNA